MRTGRSLIVCWRLLPRGVSAPGGVCSGGGSAPGGGLLPGGWGGVWSRGVSALGRSAPGGGLVLGGCLLPGGLSAPGGLCSGGGVSQHALRQTPSPPWTESQTPVKTLPWPNFVAAGKYKCASNLFQLVAISNFVYYGKLNWPTTHSWHYCPATSFLLFPL